MNISNFKNMSITERIQIMEALWDSLIYEDKEIESPEWHKTIIKERKANIASGSAKFISLKELKATRKQ
jgi:putative addiction module component (TIGR02574 family)